MSWRSLALGSSALALRAGNPPTIWRHRRRDALVISPEHGPAGSQTDEVFRPWRSEGMYTALLVVLVTGFLVVCRLETNQILESQIALGIHPSVAATFACSLPCCGVPSVLW